MDHAEATYLQAVEKYLLGELSSSEKERFEEHFFTCAECAEDVRAGAVFSENLRAVARDAAPRPFESPTKSREPGRLARLRDLFRGPALIPSLAAAAFCAITVVESAVVIPGLEADLARYRDSRAVPSFAIRAARGDEETIRIPRNAPSFTVYFDITRRRPGGYSCQVLDESNRERDTVRVPGGERGDTVTLAMDAARYHPGRYTVVVRSLSSPAEELGRYEFTLDYQ